MTTPRAVFRVLIKTLGVYFLIMGAHEVLIQSSQVLSQWDLYSRQGFGSIGSRSMLQWSVFVIVTCFELAAGLYLFFGGRFVVDTAFPLTDRLCHECGYDLSGNDTDICPECATVVAREQQSQGETP